MTTVMESSITIPDKHILLSQIHLTMQNIYQTSFPDHVSCASKILRNKLNS